MWRSSAVPVSIEGTALTDCTDAMSVEMDDFIKRAINKIGLNLTRIRTILLH